MHAGAHRGPRYGRKAQVVPRVVLVVSIVGKDNGSARAVPREQPLPPLRLAAIAAVISKAPLWVKNAAGVKVEAMREAHGEGHAQPAVYRGGSPAHLKRGTLPTRVQPVSPRARGIGELSLRLLGLPWGAGLCCEHVYL